MLPFPRDDLLKRHPMLYSSWLPLFGIQFLALSDQLCGAAGFLTETLTRNDKFLRFSLIHLKLPLADMLLRNPHFILEFSSLLTLFMLEYA
jgi:hypothetical protein